MSTFTRTSPTGGAVPSGVTEIGGIVLDLIGLNGVRVTSQLAASSLYVGFYSGNPGDIGTQTGLTPAVLSALGGGLSSVAVRVTLYDGDTSTGDFDDNDNFLLLNGISIGNFTSVTTQETDSTGVTVFGSDNGFQDETLHTGWFSTTNAATLASLWSTLTSANKVLYQVNDTNNPGDNFYDFTRGVDGGLINVGQTPNISPVAGDDSASTAAGVPVVINVKANDFDPDGTIDAYALGTGPAHGSVVLNANNTITYTPNGGFSGLDTFTYKVTDDDGASTFATVSVTVGAITPPTTNNTIIFGNTDIHPTNVSKVSDRGGNTNDKLSTGFSNGAAFKDYQQFHGGLGNDTFILKSKDFGGATQNGISKYISDFQGAGGYFAGNNDFISFSGFGAGSGLTLIKSSAPAPNQGALLTYQINDTATGNTFKILVHSTNGLGLAAGDYNFY